MTFQPGTDTASARESAAGLGSDTTDTTDTTDTADTPDTVDTATGSVLRFLACTLRARAVVEVGTGTGVSGLYLLEGMPANSVLTSIDIRPEHHHRARAHFSAAGFAATRSRLITGRGADVLPRLSSGSYDLVFLDTMLSDYPHYFELGLPLLRTGGVLALQTPPTAAGDDNRRHTKDSHALRAIGDMIRQDERLVPTWFPLANPLLVVAVGE